MQFITGEQTKHDKGLHFNNVQLILNSGSRRSLGVELTTRLDMCGQRVESRNLVQHPRMRHWALGILKLHDWIKSYGNFAGLGTYCLVLELHQEGLLPLY